MAKFFDFVLKFSYPAEKKEKTFQKELPNFPRKTKRKTSQSKTLYAYKNVFQRQRNNLLQL